MKIIGTTEGGAKLIEISNEELIALMGVSQILNEFVSNRIPPAPEAEANKRPLIKRAYRRKSKIGNPKSEIASPRLCKHCKQPLPKNAGANRLYHKDCYKLLAREQALKYWRKKHPGCKPRLTVDHSINPADPGLTDKQREELKAARLVTIGKIVEKHKYD